MLSLDHAPTKALLTRWTLTIHKVYFEISCSTVHFRWSASQQENPLSWRSCRNGLQFTVVRCIGKVADLMMNQDDPSAKFCPILVMTDGYVRQVATGTISHFRGPNVYDEYGHAINGSKCQCPKWPNAFEIYPNKKRIDCWQPGVSTLTRVWDLMTMVSRGKSISITFQTTSGKTKLAANRFFQTCIEVDSYTKVFDLLIKCFFYSPWSYQHAMGKYTDISGLNALSAYDGVIRMPLVGNGIYGTGDKMSDTMNATKAITKAARASGRGRVHRHTMNQTYGRSPQKWIENGVIRLL
jgi:hypothetical protein